MTCPRCGYADDADGSFCPQCGVVFAKLRDPDSPRPSLKTREPQRNAATWASLLVGGGLLALALVGIWAVKREPTQVPSSPGTDSAAPSVPILDVAPPPLASPEIKPPLEDLALKATSVPASDRQEADRLMRRLQSLSALEAKDVQAAEELYARYPTEQPVKRLLEAVLLGAAMQERGKRNYDQATRHIQRATALDPANSGPWLALLQIAMESGDWPGAEAAARGAITTDPTSAEAYSGLGYALYRQDRNAEAAEALETCLEIRGDPGAQALLLRIRKGIADEKGMTQQQLSHFHVRYDGEAHEDVGREILRALDRHYATLSTALDHQPTTAIPVILFSHQAFYDATGAPSWSGGAYDGIDGRIRIPIGGLTASLSPEMDQTLIHELTHAFIADRTRGAAPREIHEGLAQYMEGERLGSKLDAPGLEALAAGRIGGVTGYYLGALSLVEYLVARRGMGGINELLKAMGETGSVDLACQQVHGQTYRALQQEHLVHLRQQYGK